MYLSGVWSTPGGAKQVALKSFFVLDQNSITTIKVNHYSLNCCKYFFLPSFFYLENSRKVVIIYLQQQPFCNSSKFSS